MPIEVEIILLMLGVDVDNQKWNHYRCQW